MKFREYIAKLIKMADERPEIMEFDVVYSIDAEGNGFTKVFEEPQVGYLEDGEFQPENKANAICIN